MTHEHRFQSPTVHEVPRVLHKLDRDTFGDFAEMDKEDLAALPAAAIGAVQGFNKYYLEDKLGLVMWAAIATSVVAYDAYAMTHEVSTLTRVAHEALNTHPILTRLAIGAVALHLAAPKYSPVDLLYDTFK